MYKFVFQFLLVVGVILRFENCTFIGAQIVNPHFVGSLLYAGVVDPNQPSVVGRVIGCIA